MSKISYHPPEIVLAAIQKIAPNNAALMFDFDGTLVNFADEKKGETANDVRLPAQTRKDIEILSGRVNNALSLVTGRDRDFIETHVFSGFPLPASYGHGAYLRTRFNAAIVESAHPVDEARLDKIAGQYVLPEGVWIEKKPQARAFHWNTSNLGDQEAATNVGYIVGQICDAYNKGQPEKNHLKAEMGRKVFEIGAVSASKGAAVKSFMAVAPFKGRQPIYFGDQPADASAMKVVQALGGLNIGVGPSAPGEARYRLKNPAAVQAVVNGLMLRWD